MLFARLKSDRKYFFSYRWHSYQLRRVNIDASNGIVVQSRERHLLYGVAAVSKPSLAECGDGEDWWPM